MWYKVGYEEVRLGKRGGSGENRVEQDTIQPGEYRKADGGGDV